MGVIFSVGDNKRCTKCGIVKPVIEFGKEKRYSSGYRSWCKQCICTYNHGWNKRNPQSRVAATQKWKRNNPHKPISARLKKAYGITLEEYEGLLAQQGNRCAICSADKPGGIGRFHVDHDHVTGRVRGMLCNNCNTAIGLMRENTTILRSAIEYLIRWEVKIA